MPRKNTLSRYPILSAGDASGSLVSAVTCIEYLDNVGIQANIVSGTPTGTLDIQVSADYVQVPGVTGSQVTSNGNWVTVTSQAITSGSPAQTYFDLNQLSSHFVRLIYTAASGSGTLSAFIVGKSV